MELRRWLVTGGCGFIGRSLIAKLLDDGLSPGNIRVLDNLSVGSTDDLQGVVPYERDAGWRPEGQTVGLQMGDIRSREDVAAAMQDVQVVVHLAACTGVQPSVEDPHFDCDTNVFGTLNCLDAARHHGVERFVFASSGAPLGDVEPPIHEEALPKPISPYGASKLAGEAYCSVYYQCFGLETVTLRFGNVYGPLSSKKDSVVAKFIKQALAGDTLEIYGDGSSTRDYIYSRDLAVAITRAAATPGIGGEVFQIATNRETTVGEVADRLLAVLQRAGIENLRLIHGSARIGDMQRNYSDTSKAREKLDWQATTGLEDGLRATVDWFLERDRD